MQRTSHGRPGGQTTGPEHGDAGVQAITQVPAAQVPGQAVSHDGASTEASTPRASMALAPAPT
jgi:hypothetical protein